MQHDLEELHRKASSHYLKGEFDEAMAAWRQVLRIEPNDERGREGLRLCEELRGSVEVSGESASASPPPSPAVETPAPATVAPPEDDTAAGELRRRVEQLLSEATMLVEGGETDAALRTIDRVLILDEENEKALELRRRVLDPGAPPSGMEPATPPAPADGPGIETAAETAGEPDAILRGNEGIAPLHTPQVAPAADPPPPPRPAPPIMSPEPHLELDADLLRAELSATTKAVTAGSRVPPWLRDRRVQLAGVGVLVIVGGLVTMQMLGGEEPSAPPPPLVQRHPAKPKPEPAPTDPQAAKPAMADPNVSSKPETAPVTASTDPAELMREAETAFAAEDYGAAVIAYDRVLKEDPDNTEARVKLRLASERYRDEKARQQKWDDAVAAFEQQNYAEAMRHFYRMKNEDYAADIDRIKINGWYNLGLTALQAKDCKRAVEQFEEALTIDPREPEVLEAISLAETCHGPEVAARIRRLTYRGLTD